MIPFFWTNVPYDFKKKFYCVRRTSETGWLVLHSGHPVSPQGTSLCYAIGLVVLRISTTRQYYGL